MNAPDLSNGLLEWMGAAAVAAGGVVLGVQKALKNWVSTDRDIKSSVAERDVIDLLRKELQRMSEQNDKLATLVNKLQSQVADLSGKNARLKQQIETLHFEVDALRGPQGLQP